jgi:hypothetical protein
MLEAAAVKKDWQVPPDFVVVQFGTVPLAYRNLPDSVAESLLSSAQRLQRFQMLPARLVLFCT